MIKHKSADYNLSKIIEEMGQLELGNAAQYYIFGNKEKDGQKHVEIHYSEEQFPQFHNFAYLIRSFLEFNGLGCRQMTGRNYVSDNPKIIKVGLRRDLRDYPLLSANILKTIILASEGKIKYKLFKYNTTIPNLPKLQY